MAASHFPNPSAITSLRVRGLVDEAELLAEAIVDTVRESLLILDRNLYIRLASRSFYLTFHVSPEETLDRLVYEIGNGQWDIPELRQLLEEILPRNSSFQDFEVTHAFPHLGHRTMQLNARRLRRRTDQENLILLAIEDVTAIRERRERDAFAAAVLRSSGEAFIGLSADGVIRTWNPAAERLFGYKAEEVVGSSLSKLTPATTEFEDILKRLQNGDAVTTETVQLTKTGQPVTVILNASPVSDAGQVVGASIALTDISERKQIEEQLRESEQNLAALLQQKQVLVRETHHRVKNNLQMIVSLLNLHARQAAGKPEVVAALTDASGRVQTIARLHETLYTSEALAEIDFGEYLRKLTGELWRLHGRADVKIETLADDIVLGLDTAIPLGLIANELILNCFKHAFPGGRGGQVRVSVEYVRDSVAPGEPLDQAALRLTVQDDGVGLPAGVDIEQTQSLGIRLVRLFARQLHAEVRVGSGNGCTFSVLLPPQPPPPDQVEPAVEKSPHSDL